MKGVRTCKLDFYEHYIIGKNTKVKFGTSTHCTDGTLDYVHTDVWGPTKTASIGDNHFVTFIDDYSKQCWVYTMKHKGKVLELFVEWKKNLEKSTGRKIKVLWLDNRGEYKSDPFLKLCRDEGIDMYFTVRKIPNKMG